MRTPLALATVGAAILVVPLLAPAYYVTLMLPFMAYGVVLLGFNLLFGPLLLRVHFGHPFDIGGVRTPALQRGSSWVTNVTLRYFFY